VIGLDPAGASRTIAPGHGPGDFKALFRILVGPELERRRRAAEAVSISAVRNQQRPVLRSQGRGIAAHSKR